MIFTILHYMAVIKFDESEKLKKHYGNQIVKKLQ